VAGRIASPTRFRAEAALVPWNEIAPRHLAQLDQFRGEARGLKYTIDRIPEVHLRWMCSETLGAPPGPFTVWVRRSEDRREEIDLSVRDHPLGALLAWGGRIAVTLEIEFEPDDPDRGVALWGFLGPAVPSNVVGVEARFPSGPGRMSLLLRTTGMTSALLVNGRDPTGAVDYLRDVIDDEGWRELEFVGLPVDSEGWGSTVYDTRLQGSVDSPVEPVEAAVDRLERGGPPLGWWPVTETGRLSPPWEAPDYKLLVEEVRTELLPEVEGLYDPGVAPHHQAGLRTTRSIPPPEQDGRTASAASRAELPPFGALMLAGTTDPFLALATGFGTAYPVESKEWEVFGRDFMVTADYPDTPEGGPATYAAVVPWPGPHRDTAPVTGLAAEREGLVRPQARDGPWRETVRIRWDHVESSAALGRPSGAGLARFDPAGGPLSESLLTARDSGGWRTLVPTRAPSQPNAPPADHDRAVDAALEIPLGSGGHSVGYAVAVHDVFGVWSPWEVATHSGAEPDPPSPRILGVRLDTSYVGFAQCPSTIEVQFALDWSDRTAERADLFVLLFPAASSGAGPPITTPTASTPPGCSRADVTINFAGDDPAAAGGEDVRCLDPAGEQEVTPGPAQSEEARRYLISFSGPILNFASTRYWGLAVWAEEQAIVLPAPGPISPPLGPALAYAGSPVPPVLPPPPSLPGVPVGSAPDAQGQSHVGVSWTAPGGDVARFVIWEVGETAVRTAAGLPARAAEGTVPGQRLLDLRTAFNGLSATEKRAVFRRAAEASATARDRDVALERGSTDIHLFAVTAVSHTNIESGWPSDATHLRAFMAPRIRAPAAPSLVPSFVPAGGGAVQLQLDVSAYSDVPVERFLLFRTRSEVAARSAETMGPPFAEVVAAATTDPPTPTGGHRYEATWTGPIPEGWEPTRLRAVAIPVAEVPVEAMLGVPSPGSPQVPVQVPPSAPPDLDLLDADDWGPGEIGVVVGTSTSAPTLPTPFGPHVLRVAVAPSGGGAPLFPPVAVHLDDVPLSSDLSVPPDGADAGLVVVRGDVAAGRTPLAIWFQRPAVTDPVRVTTWLADPLGKYTERVIEVPAGPLGAPPSLDVLEFFRIVGRGVVIRFRSDAPIVAAPDGPHMLEVSARAVRGGPWWPLEPIEPPIRLPAELRGPPAPVPLRLVVPLPNIPRSRPDLPLPAADRILVVRVTTEAPHDYQLLVRVEPPLEVAIAIVAADGLRTNRLVRMQT
jgi:hypothetical protein